MASRRVSPEELKSLRWFRHFPRMGGHANVYWESLIAQIPFKDAADLARMLGALGYREPVAEDRGNVTLGILPNDLKIYATVTFTPLMPGGYRCLSLSFFLTDLPEGTSADELRRARRVEELLDRGGVPRVPEPVFPRQSSRKGVEPLRYFEYFPPIPGYAVAYPGCLTAVIPFVQTALLERVLDAVGQKIELPLKDIQADLGFVPVEGKPLSVSITVDPKGPPCPEVTLTRMLTDLPEGVSAEELAWAGRVEALLEARGVPPSRTVGPDELETLSYFRLAPPSPGRDLFRWDSLVARLSAPDEGALRQILAALGQKDIPVSGLLAIDDFKVQIWVRSAPGVEGPVPAVVELWLDAAPPPWVSLRELEQVRRVEALLARGGVPV